MFLLNSFENIINRIYSLNENKWKKVPYKGTFFTEKKFLGWELFFD